MLSRILVSVIAVALTGCGGSGVEMQSGAAAILSQGTSITRSSNTSEGLVWRTLEGGGRQIYFDRALDIEEPITSETTYVTNINSKVSIGSGFITQDNTLIVSASNSPSALPAGSMTYIGNGQMLINLTDRFGVVDEIRKNANAVMSINFDTNSGQINVASTDTKSNISANVDTYQGTWIRGLGTFTTSDDNYSYYTPYWSNGGDSLLIDGEYVPATYPSISEPSAFDGTLTGNQAQGAMGIFIGDKHAVAVSLE